MPEQNTIVLVDDHTLFREGVRTIIENDRTFRVIGEAGTGREAVDMVGELKPDVAVVDISLPDKSGLQVTREIAQAQPDIRIMIVSMHSKIDYIAEAFQSGAVGYLVKESASERLLQGLEDVCHGKYFLDSSVSPDVIKKLVGIPARKTKIADEAYATLTNREQEILRLLAEGLSTKDIGEQLFVSPKTVENHRASIMKKLDFHSTLDIVKYAAKLGLIDLDRWKEQG